MAEFSSLVITEKGQALVTKIMMNGGNGLGFTKIATSETAYPESTLSSLTELTGVKQTAGISNIEKVSSTQVKLEAGVENSTVTEGYTINTIGLYATDPDDGEILYAVCRALVAGYIPAYNGLSVSGATFELVVGVGAASNVNLDIDPAVVATFGDIVKHEKKNPTSEGGIHGVRFLDDKFEIYNGRNWVEMQKAYKTYGVSIDLTNSDPTTAVTYTDDAVGMIAGSSDWDNTNIFRDIRPCMFKDGKVKEYLNPDNFTKYIDGTAADISSGAEGDVMIEIPKLGVKIATSNNTLTVQVTDDPNAEGFHYYAHTRTKEGDRDKLYIGAFLGYNASSKLRSLCSKQPTVNVAIGETRTLAQANGDGYDQIAFYQLTLLQCLFLIRYKSRDSQTALGKGYVNDSSGNTGVKTGGTIAKGMNYGETTGMQQMKFLGIEDFWGNFYYWIDGLVSSSDYHALTATDNFNDTGSGYKDNGALGSSYIGGYMKAPQGTSELGFIIKQAGGSSTTYFADYARFYSASVAYFGGYWAEGSYAGAFQLDVHEDASYAADCSCGRLMYL